MKFTLSWLKKYLDTSASLDQICCKLTDIGLEVEEITDSSKALEPFYVAQIINAAPHPESAKLQICQVDIGDGQTSQIICGAKNARKNLKVALAPLNSVIPTNNLKIKKAKLLGIESCGMLCSASELGLGEDSDGIIEIDDKYPVKTKIADIFNQNDPLIEINITPNRGDCLGVYGIARDLAASGLGQLIKPRITQIKGDFTTNFDLKISDQNACPLFAMRHIKNIKNNPSPKWLKDALQSVGINSICAIVDITNYVMIAIGKPMHAYDASKIDQYLSANFATKDQEFISLKEQKYQLNNNDLIISDASGHPQALAGIIGGQYSAWSDQTTEILLESAIFDPILVAKSGRLHNINSDSRYRFERGSDPSSVIDAINLATNLILEICGGSASEVKIAKNQQITQKIIDFDPNLCQKLIGIDIKEQKITEILQNLGFNVEKSSKILKITIPAWRNDVTIAQDLVEEVTRIYGYNNIPSIPLNTTNINILKPQKSDILRNFLAKNNDEAINFSFIESKTAQFFATINDDLRIINPISNKMDYMRPNLLAGLLQNAANNLAKNTENLSLFEIGNIFTSLDPINGQAQMAAGIKIGKIAPKNIYGQDRNVDCADVKKDIFESLNALQIASDSVQISTQNLPNYYHPQKSATLKQGKNILGHFGEIHPHITKKFTIKRRVYAFEIFLDNLPTKKAKITAKKALQITDKPIVLRDFSFILDQEIIADDITKYAKKADPKMIKAVNIFDIYQGDKIQPNKKSIAFNIEIHPQDQTLKGDEIDIICQKVITNIQTNLNGILRDGSN